MHGIGGAFGSVATGLLATPFINTLARTGLFVTESGHLGYTASGLDLLVDQSFAVAVVAAYAFVLTLGLLWLADKLIGLRVPAEAEQVGLDLYEHGEKASSQSDLPAPTPAVRIVRYSGHEFAGK